MNVGADTYLAEPVVPAELIAHVSAALRWRRAEERLRESNARIAALYEDAQRANRAKDEFLAVLSHELRTPLNAMLGWIQLLRGGRLDAGQQTQALEIIERNANAQARLIEDLLDVSRIISGQMAVSTQPVDLVEVVQNAVQSVAPAAAAKGLEIEAETPETPVCVAGEPARLEQIAVNLLSNAIKFSELGPITVRLRSSGERALLEVQDRGVGIEPSFLPFVFDRFSQADASRTRTRGGLGLGLAITRHIVEAHGGRIAVESEGRGRGATFRVDLPKVAENAKPGGASAGRRPMDVERPLEGLRLLLVEDDPDSRNMMTLFLELSGAEVKSASNAVDALQMLQEQQPDVMLADVGLPQIDGYMLVRQMHEQGFGTPAIALTGYASADDRDKAIAAGFSEHLGKPVSLDALVRVLTSVSRR
jgi:signal transduction histidine kinase/CheY-like chemotaxis protein